MKYEDQVISTNYKFGVLYCTRATREEELYDNEHGSTSFEEFLTLLGEKVELLNFPHYNGGLDTQC